MDKQAYVRIRIEGNLTTTSILHCGNGETQTTDSWVSIKNRGKQGHINSVCKMEYADNTLKPYLPAATLRGSLRSHCQNSVLLDRLFGQTDNRGKLRIYDAPLTQVQAPEDDLFWNKQASTSLRDGVSLDPITGTAEAHKLFVHEVVMTGTVFRVSLEVDDMSQQQLEQLIDLLNCWDGTLNSSIGKGRSKGWGCIKWSWDDKHKPQVQGLTAQAVNQWMQQAVEKKLHWNHIPITLDNKRADNSGFIQNLLFKLKPESPLLINDSARVVKETPKDPNDKKVFTPHLAFMRNTEGQAIIPGSSLRGVIRNHARKIILTIAHQYEENIIHAGNEQIERLVNPILHPLFGNENKRSLIWFSDVIAENTEKHEQYFNAIDRFTGGVIESALYSAEAAECDTMTGQCSIDEHPQRQPSDNAWKGLLLLVARDLIEEDLVVGWGKSRGFGRVRLILTPTESQTISDLPALMAAIEHHFPHQDKQQWIDALHQHIKQSLETHLSEL